MGLRIAGGVAAATFASLAFTAASAQDYSDFPDRPIQFIAQAAPGSGFDQTTRAAAQCLEQEGLVDVGMPVTNMPSSAVGAQTIATRHVGDPYMLSFNSLSLMMRYATGSVDYTHEDFTPIARLTSDYYAVVVREDSPLQNLEQLLDALREDPRAFPLVGGQSDDRVFYGMLFSRTGIDPSQVNYIPFSGGGEASALLLEGSAGAQFSTLSDVVGLISSGDLRALAVSSGERLDGEVSHIPTLIEQGVDLEWTNFRYAMGGPEMPEPVVAYWEDTLAKMVETECWEETLARHAWGDEFMIEGFDEFLDETQEQIIEVTNRIGIGVR